MCAVCGSSEGHRPPDLGSHRMFESPVWFNFGGGRKFGRSRRDRPREGGVHVAPGIARRSGRPMSALRLLSGEDQKRGAEHPGSERGGWDCRGGAGVQRRGVAAGPRSSLEARARPRGGPERRLRALSLFYRHSQHEYSWTQE